MSEFEGVKEDRIKRRAFELWQHAGEPDGRSEEHWETAKQEIEEADTAEASRQELVAANPSVSA